MTLATIVVMGIVVMIIMATMASASTGRHAPVLPVVQTALVGNGCATPRSRLGLPQLHACQGEEGQKL